jgi:hypothetical protein
MQALQLKWPRSRKGYEVLEIRQSAISGPARATVDERRLLAKWDLRRYGFRESGGRDKDGEIVHRLIFPRDENMRVADVLANSPDIFIEFANIDGSEARLLEFVNKFGCLDDRAPEVSRYLAEAARVRRVLSQFENDEKAGSHRWLSIFEKPQYEFLPGKGDLRAVPKLTDGKVEVFLEPPDLLRAIWLQFLLKANALTITHCHSCSSFIALAASLGRSDKRFCSTACKQRDYRRREAEKRTSRTKTAGARRIAKRRHSA